MKLYYYEYENHRYEIFDEVNTGFLIEHEFGVTELVGSGQRGSYNSLKDFKDIIEWIKGKNLQIVELT